MNIFTVESPITANIGCILSKQPVHVGLIFIVRMRNQWNTSFLIVG